VPEDEGDAVQTQDNRGRRALIPERSKFVTGPKRIKRERGVDDDADDTQHAKRKRGVSVSNVPSGRHTGSQLEGGFSGMEIDMGGGEPSFGDVPTSTNVQGHHRVQRRPAAMPEEPLFLPATQMTQADVEAFKAAGLGDAEDLEALLDDDDIENDLNDGSEIVVDNDPGGRWGNMSQGGGDGPYDGTLIEATQLPPTDDHNAFKPLFDD
jgi:hypothetical protein